MPEQQQYLSGTGWVDWPTAAAALQDCDSAAWSDLQGVHIGGVPGQPPTTTHLWGWAPEALYRVRVDGDRAVVATLTPQARGDSTPVPVLEARSGTWAENHVRVGDASGISWELVEVVNGSVMTFLRPADDSAAGAEAHGY